MAVTKVCLLIVVALSCYPQLQCKHYLFSTNFHRKGVCTYKGYIPGGGKPNIRPIQAPGAKIPSGVLATIAGVSSTAIGGVDTVLNAITSIASIASKLSPVLQLMGSLFGFIAGEANPSPQEILQKANKAIAKLTTEVNKRLDKMKGYVDYRVIHLEKDLTNRQFRSLFNLFAGCINEVTKERVNECMRNAERKTAADAPKFMILGEMMATMNAHGKSRAYYDKHPSRALSYYNVKRLEAGILSFRDYANIHLLMISTLLETYKADPSLQHAAAYVRGYTKKQATAARTYVAYLNWASRWIYDRNVGENLHGNFKHACTKAIPKTLTLFKILVEERSFCALECTGMNIPAVCQYRATLLYYPTTKVRRLFIPVSSAKQAVTFVGNYYGKKFICKPFLASLQRDIITTYKNTLLTSLQTWKKIASKASHALRGDEPAAESIRDDMAQMGEDEDKETNAKRTLEEMQEEDGEFGQEKSEADDSEIDELDGKMSQDDNPEDDEIARYDEESDKV